MTENTAWTVIGVAFALALGALFFFVAQGTAVAHVEGTKRIAACVEAGGSWLDQYNVCINNNGGDGK